MTKINNIDTREELELLSSNKKYTDYRIRRLKKEWFTQEEEYLKLKAIWLNDEEIIEQILNEAESNWLFEELDKLINSWKEKVDKLLEL